MRVFLAFPISLQVSDALCRVQERWKMQLRDVAVSWERSAQFHVTAVFLGELDDQYIDELGMAVEYIAHKTTSFDLTLADCGAFPTIHRPRILYAGVRDVSGAASSVVAMLEASLHTHGIAEPIQWQPHITLGKVKRDLQIPWQAPDVNPITWTVDAIDIVQSKLTQHGATYHTIKTVRFGA